MKKKEKRIDLIFNLLFIVLIFAYFPAFIKCLINGYSFSGSFSRALLKGIYLENLFDKVIRFSKDVIIFIITIYCFIKMKFKIQKKVFTILLPIVVYGMFSLALSGMFSFSMIISGLRGYLYFIIPIIFLSNKKEKTHLTNFVKLISKLFYIEFFVICIEFICAYLKNHSFSFIGSWRLPGTFSGGGTMSFFAIGSLMVFFVYKYLFNEQIKDYYIKMIMASIMCILSGTRTNMIICCIFMMYSLALHSKKILSKKNQQFRVMFFSFILICLFPLIISIIENLVDRGSILGAQVEGGRISVLFNYLKYTKVIQLFLGYGLGYGTNSAINLEQLNGANTNSIITDGAFTTVLTQFGLVGLIICLIILLIVFINCYRKNKSVVVIIFEGIFIFTCLCTNVFEIYIYISIMGVLFYYLYYGESNKI